MRTTTTLESVINSVHEQSANHYDNIVPVRDMRFESLVRMNIAGQSFGVLRSAQRLLANRLRVSFSYLNRCPVELQAENLNYHTCPNRVQVNISDPWNIGFRSIPRMTM
jgi:hypothetical protein